MKCPTCQSVVPSTVRFCAYCGAGILAAPPSPAARRSGLFGFLWAHKALSFFFGLGSLLLILALFYAMNTGDEEPAMALALPPPTATAEPAPEPAIIPTETPVPTVGPTEAPVPAVVPTDTPAPTATPIPTPEPTATPVPTVTPTPSPTPIPAATPTPTPVPTATLIPTNTPRPTATPVPTDTPQPTPTLRPTATPTPTPRPTPTQVPWKDHTGKGDKWGYTVEIPRNWRSARGGKQAELRSSDGRATLTISVKDYPEKLPPQQFAEEHRASLIAKYAYASNFFNILDFRGVFLDGNQWFRLSWRLQQKSDSCVLDITDLVSRSRNFPGWDQGYVLSFRVCDEHLPAHLKDRKRILDSFRELAP